MWETTFGMVWDQVPCQMNVSCDFEINLELDIVYVLTRLVAATSISKTKEVHACCNASDFLKICDRNEG